MRNMLSPLKHPGFLSRIIDGCRIVMELVANSFGDNNYAPSTFFNIPSFSNKYNNVTAVKLHKSPTPTIINFMGRQQARNRQENKVLRLHSSIVVWNNKQTCCSLHMKIRKSQLLVLLNDRVFFLAAHIYLGFTIEEVRNGRLASFSQWVMKLVWGPSRWAEIGLLVLLIRSTNTSSHLQIISRTHAVFSRRLVSLQHLLIIE